jgi:hypothetical protein
LAGAPYKSTAVLERRMLGLFKACLTSKAFWALPNPGEDYMTRHLDAQFCEIEAELKALPQSPKAGRGRRESELYERF